MVLIVCLLCSFLTTCSLCLVYDFTCVLIILFCVLIVFIFDDAGHVLTVFLFLFRDVMCVLTMFFFVLYFGS
jgi:hypothetical protein